MIPEQISNPFLLTLLEIITLFGLCLLLAGLFLLARGGPSQFWPTTRARIVYSLLEESKSQKVLADGSFKTIVKYEPVIVYKYVVRKTTYTSRTISSRPIQLTPKAAKNLTRRYPRGLIVKIRYKPTRPEDSVLIAAPSWLGIILALWGLITAGAGIFILYSLTV